MTGRQTIAAFRFGYGPFAGAAAAEGPAAALAGPDRMAAAIPGIGFADLGPLLAERREAQRAVGAGDRRYRQAQAALQAAFLDGARRDIARAVGAEDGFRERLVRFWADHFTVRARQPRFRAAVSAFVDEAIRPHVTGTFAGLLGAAATHPAMLIYLDQRGSVGPNSRFGRRKAGGLNENLARELLELHTLGAGGGYAQSDVTQLAELLTGLSIDGDLGTAFFPERAEPGGETVLGRTYGGDGRARIEDLGTLFADLAVHPATARHIARKLAVHFVADEPDPALVSDLAAVWVRTGGDLMAVSRALAEHPAAWTPVFGKVRQPFDFVVAALRALGVGADRVLAMEPRLLRRSLLNPMALMGQPWQAPRGPDGWPEAEDAWITPQGLAARIDWAMQMPAELVKPLPDPRVFVVAALGEAAAPELRTAVARSENLREGVGLVLAAPAFNRR